MRLRLTLFLFFIIMTNLSAQVETPLSGVINQYASVNIIDYCGNAIVVDDASGFRADDQVILIQMQGATVDAGENSNDSNFGTLENLGEAGLYEKNTIQSINGNRIVLERVLLHTYDVLNALQLVSMPVYENAITVDTVKAMPWDGSKGGVIAFEVVGELKVDARISAEGQGFRGGQAVAVQPNDCSFTNPQRSYYFSENNWRGAPKGESISKFITDREWGRGSQANGGGGGNDHNSGGGGGANITAGGVGGRNNVSGLFLCNGNNPGLGGKALPEEEGRVYLGGGGGAGHTNNTLPGAAGGRGGGIVMIKAAAITRINEGIYADGQSVGEGEGDGAGGGGAGGTILLEADSLSEDILVHAFGGHGGTVNNIGDPTRCFGPGGGGAGGRILLTKMLSLPNTSFQVTGGLAGRSINSNQCPEGSNGTEAGENGVIGFFSGLVENPDSFAIPKILGQPTLVQACTGNPVLLEIETAGNNLIYQWQINSGNGFVNLGNDANFSGTQTPSLSITEASPQIISATFRLFIDNGCGNQVTSDPIQLEEGALPDVNFNLSINNLDLSVISVTPENATNYLWDFGDGNTSTLPTPTHTYERGGDYEVKVTVRNACGADSLSQIVPVRDLAPTADFTYSDTTGCTPVNVRFQNASTPDAVSFQWTFLGGIPATSMEENPTVVYETAGSYQVRLIVFDIDGGSDTLVRAFNVDVTPEPTADFEFLATGLSVSFDNLSSDADTYLWDFGDGGPSSSDTAPTRVFPETGTYEVSLIALNDCGRDTLEVLLSVVEPPAANFVIDTIQGCSIVEVTYQNTTMGDYDRIAWSFQGGSPDFSTEERPVVTYTVGGQYEVILVAFNDGGSTTSIQSIDIEISDPPEAGFTINAADLVVDIQDNAQNADELCWLIEQDTALIEQITGPLNQYTFDSPGTYRISQIAKSDCGADTLSQLLDITSSPLANFEFDTNSGCEPLSINIRNTSTFADSYEWIFEGGQPNSSNSQEPIVTYTQSGSYEWMLIAINASGRDTITRTVQVDVLSSAIADFEEQQQGILGITLKSLAENADSLCWLIGEEAFPRLAVDSFFSYTFPAPGTYSYGLIAKNECGADTLRAEITLNGIPVPEMRVIADSGCAPVQVEVFSDYFAGELSQYLEGFEISQIGEGSYTDPVLQDGRYIFETTASLLQFRLKVSSDFGSDSLVLEVPITVQALPQAGFDFDHSNGYTVNFTDVSSDARTYLWDFGDGNTSTANNPIHTYAELGDYQVSLIVSNDCGSDTLIQNVQVNIVPVAAYDIEKNGECAPLQIQLIDRSQGLGNRVRYEFAGVPVVPIDEVNNIYEVRGGGVLSITMNVENELGTDVLTQNLSVGVAPTAGFASQTNGLTINFSDQSSNADQLRWDFGDGSSSQERSPSHAYAAEGEYTVQLIASNDCGEDTLSRIVVAGEVLESKFIAVNSFGCTPHLVQFRNRSTGNVSSLEWSFPGGTPATSIDPDPQVLYTQVGTYPVSLTVNGPLGSSTTTTNEMVRIVNFPSADFSYEVDGFQVRFTNLSENADGYRWEFGDGASSTEENPVHTFTRGGVFSVTLNATIATCGSSITMNIPVMLSDAEDVFASEDIKVFPNPVKDWLFVESRATAIFPLKFELISTQGQLLLSRILGQQEQIDLQAFPTGLYYIRLSNQEKEWIGKLLKVE